MQYRRLFSTIPSHYQKLQTQLQGIIAESKQQGTYKVEHPIESQQKVLIMSRGKEALNFCANNYLGLSNDSRLINAAKETMDSHGFGLSSVRFICGTQDIHKKLEKTISDYYEKDDTIMYSSCFDANAGFFETFLTQEDAIISDSLNHASIIDGVRMCKAQRFRYDHLNMADLEEQLKKCNILTNFINQSAAHCRNVFIVTDGVFSMDGDIAPLDKIVNLAYKYGAYTFVDECHATGFIGPNGKGTPELFGVLKEIDIITGTLGKSLGGASGGYTVGRKELIEIQRQKSRPYLFSNSLAPAIVGASIKVFDIMKQSPELRERLQKNTRDFRGKMKAAGFNILGHDECPIAPVYIGDAKLASKFSDMMYENGIFVIAFSYPVVPKDKARIRVQLSAAHTEEQIQMTVDTFIKCGKELGIIA